MTPLLSLALAFSVAAAPEAAPEVHVPFGCNRSFPVSQAHETGSHLNNDSFAWDFRMPEGVPITAAADGEIRLARGDSSSGGCGIEWAKDANYVVITHEGGLETQYLHFARVVVKAGARVKAGELIGYSGKTGWACGSHLHFKVARTVGEGWNNPSVPARVRGYGDPQAGDLIDAGACSEERPYLASLDELSRDEKVAERPSPLQGTPVASSSGASGGDKVDGSNQK
jgi:murein DD-endopeptidase MepM/ murein hydrolase activator NlpD